MKRRFIKLLILTISTVLLTSGTPKKVNIDKSLSKVSVIDNVEIKSRKELIEEMIAEAEEIKRLKEIALKEAEKIEQVEEIESEEEVIEESEIIEENYLTPITVELTGYCDCAYCCGVETGITAMGTHTRVGVIAVPQELELGTNIYIPLLTPYKSDGVFYGEDRGGAIIRKSDGTFVLDVWFPTHEQALEFGRRTTTAYLI